MNSMLDHEEAVNIASRIFADLTKGLKPLSREDQANAYHVGLALWDIFSDNHAVLTESSEEVDIGSWRGSGGVLADILNDWVGNGAYGYMDFYMGSNLHVESEGLIQEYGRIFRWLKDEGFDWEYSVPEMGMINFGEDKTNEKTGEMQKMLDAINEEMEAKVYEKIPFVVRGYNEVYGKLPRGYRY